MNLTLSHILQKGDKGAFYGRHSTKEQKMDAQFSSALELAHRYGCTIDHIYEDPGVSARKVKAENRKGLHQLLADALTDKYKFLIISNHDRLARNPSDHHMIREIMKQKNIPVIISSTESLYNSGDFIVDLIKDGTSKYEVENTRIRTRDTLRKIAREGKWTGGKAPYGYEYKKIDKNKSFFIVKEDEIKIVQRIYELYRDNEGLQSIANIVTQEFKTNINKTRVKWIVTNPFYAGYITLYRKKGHSGSSITNQNEWTMVKSNIIPAIISLEEWQELWAIYQERKSGNLTPKLYRTSFLFNKFVRCSCGHLLACKDQTTKDRKTNEPQGYKYYFCTSCDYRIDADKLHQIVNVLISDINKHKLDEITDQVLQSVQNEKLSLSNNIASQQLLVGQLDYDIKVVEKNIEWHIKMIDEFDKSSDNHKFVNILLMQKQDFEGRKQQAISAINEMQTTLKYIDTIDLNRTYVKSTLDKLSKSILGTDNVKLRKMLLYLVKEISFEVIAKTEGKILYGKKQKGKVVKANVRVITRNDWIYSIIS